MFCDNLTSLRKLNGMSQEALAARLGISRQMLSRYESGQSLPDIEKCKAIAEIFDVTMDDLVSFDSARTGVGVPPRGKHLFGLVSIGDKGQIVIPVQARRLFNLQPGDKLILLGDEEQGLALVSAKKFEEMSRAFLSATGADTDGEDT